MKTEGVPTKPPLLLDALQTRASGKCSAKRTIAVGTGGGAAVDVELREFQRSSPLRVVTHVI